MVGLSQWVSRISDPDRYWFLRGRTKSIMKAFPKGITLRKEFTFAVGRCVVLLFVHSMVWVVGLGSCHKDPAPVRSIRSHVSIQKGVSHAEPSQRPRVYCIKCHGDTLQGGAKGEPSCFGCHGVQWTDDETRQSRAPTSHSQPQGGFFHHPDLRTPEQSCSPCHGVALQGNIEQGVTYPGCELCHVRLWEDPTATP